MGFVISLKKYVTCHMLNVGATELIAVVKIGDKKLFRAKVLNAEKLSELLMVTLYIQRFKICIFKKI